MNYLRQKKNADKWLPARRPGVRQKRKMLALVISYGVHTAISCHTYKVGDSIYHQQAGGSIGLELTGAVSRPFMLRWDKLYKDKVERAGIDIRLYERYVDDSNQVVTVPAPGSVYDAVSEKVVIDANQVEADIATSDDVRTARVMTDIANTVIPGIIMEFDVPSNNTDMKIVKLICL